MIKPELPLFISFNEPNIEINNLIYGFTKDITNDVNIKKIIGCASSIFNVESDDFQHKGIFMRFKRVSNYDDVDSI